jgi:hypothetical protein
VQPITLQYCFEVDEGLGFGLLARGGPDNLHQGEWELWVELAFGNVFLRGRDEVLGGSGGTDGLEGQGDLGAVERGYGFLLFLHLDCYILVILSYSWRWVAEEK